MDPSVEWDTMRRHTDTHTHRSNVHSMTAAAAAGGVNGGGGNVEKTCCRTLIWLLYEGEDKPVGFQLAPK